MVWLVEFVRIGRLVGSAAINFSFGTLATRLSRLGVDTPIRHGVFCPHWQVLGCDGTILPVRLQCVRCDSASPAPLVLASLSELAGNRGLTASIPVCPVRVSPTMGGLPVALFGFVELVAAAGVEPAEGQVMGLS